MQLVEAMSERIPCWLSFNMEVRALAERVLERFAVTVGDLPASGRAPSHRARRVYQHSLDGAHGSGANSKETSLQGPTRQQLWRVKGGHGCSRCRAGGVPKLILATLLRTHFEI